jgi:hypothetical protein
MCGYNAVFSHRLQCAFVSGFIMLCISGSDHKETLCLGARTLNLAPNLNFSVDLFAQNAAFFSRESGETTL